MSEALGDIDFSEDYKDLSSGTKELIEKEVKRIIDESRARATALLQERRTELDRIAKALVEYETLNQEELQKVVRGEKLPDKLKLLPNVPVKLPEGIYSGPTLEGGPGNTGDVNPGEKEGA
jgi:ATP-dependent metalloprotease